MFGGLVHEYNPYICAANTSPVNSTISISSVISPCPISYYYVAELIKSDMTTVQAFLNPYWDNPGLRYIPITIPGGTPYGNYYIRVRQQGTLGSTWSSILYPITFTAPGCIQPLAPNDASMTASKTKERGNESFTFMPNPASSSITVHSEENGTIEIFDFKGNRVSTQIGVVGESFVDISQLPTGYFWIRFIGQSSVSAFGKLIVIR
jgi:hypothetical protein